MLAGRFAPGRSDTAPRSAPAAAPGDSARGNAPAIDTTGFALRARQAFARGRKLEARQPEAAIRAYRTALYHDPRLPEANYRLGLALMRAGLAGHAAQAFQSEIELRPEHFDARRERGVALAALGEHAAAIDELEELTKRVDTSDRAWQALGYAYRAAGRNEDAERALRRAIALPPGRAEEHRDLGVLLAAAGRGAEARAEYARGAEMDPRDGSVWFNLGNLEQREGNSEAALAAYRQAERRDSTMAAALRGQVHALLALGRGDQAGDVYRRATRRLPGDHELRREGVRHFAALGRADLGLALAAEGVRRRPRAGEAWLVMAEAHQHAGNDREALRDVRRAERWFPDPLNRIRASKLAESMIAAAPESLRAELARDTVGIERGIR